MKKLFRLLVFVLLVGGWLAFASSVHVVRTADRNFVIVPKNRLHLWRQTYLDARAWTLAEAQQHPMLVQRMIDSGKADRLSHVGTMEQLTVIAESPVPVIQDVPTPTSKPAARS